MKCLAKDPDERYGDPADLLPDLRDLLRESVPPEDPIAHKLAEDRTAQARKRAFASRPSLPSVSEAPSPLPQAAGGTEPIADDRAARGAASRPQITTPLDPSFVPVHPISGRLERARTERTTLPMEPGFVPQSPASPWAQTQGAPGLPGRGHTLKMQPATKPELPPSSSQGWAPAPSRPPPPLPRPAALSFDGEMPRLSQARARLSYVGAGTALGVSIAVMVTVFVFGVRPRARSAEAEPARITPAGATASVPVPPIADVAATAFVEVPPTVTAVATASAPAPLEAPAATAEAPATTALPAAVALPSPPRARAAPAKLPARASAPLKASAPPKASAPRPVPRTVTAATAKPKDPVEPIFEATAKKKRSKLWLDLP
jgi:hypothetical protein